MDVRPVVALKTLCRRGIALILANALFWQPLLAQAEGIVVSAPGTTVGQAGNGVPVVNIATPNGSGLSHNQFKDYNVGPNGVILNNATGAVTNTQLGGYIIGNPNLKGGAANVILNEVNGGSPSQLRGFTEVAGQSAKVIVANPYGVTCNGCGFINTPSATLTTGKPVIDKVGRLDHYQVDGGAVTIDGQGLNASNVDHFEIITRSAKINAQINARELTVIAGRNDVDAQSLKTTVRADDGSAKPELAIDSSALGGMYAGAIKLVGTEAGVGVKLDGTLAASGGDIQLDANGRLSMAQATTTTGNIKATAQHIELTDKVYAARNVELTSAQALVNQKSVAAGQRIELNAATVTNAGVIEAGVQADNSRNASGDLVVNAQTVNTSGNLLASRNLAITAAQALTNQGAVIQGKTVSVNTAKLTNQGETARLYGLQNLTISAPAIVNMGGLIRFGEGQVATLDSVSVDNRGGQIVASDLTVTADAINNRGGALHGQEQLTLTGNTLDNSADGQISGKRLNLTARDTFTNQGGLVEASEGFALAGGHVDNSTGGQLRGLGATGNSINATRLDNGGEVVSGGDLDITLSGDMTNSGRVSALQKLSVVANNVSQNGGRMAAINTQLNLSGTLDNLGFLTARQQLDIAAAQINNRGTLGALGPVNLTATQGITNGADSLLFSGSDLTLRGNSFSNAYGDVYTQGNLTFAAQDGGQAAVFSNLSGTVEAEGAIGINAAFVENAKAEFELVKTVTAGTVEWRCGQHCGGHDWFKRGQVNINQTLLESAIKDSAPARLLAGKDLLIQGDNVQNRYSLLAANGNLAIVANNLLNQGAGTRTGQNSIVLGTLGKIARTEWDQMEYEDIPAFNALGEFDAAKFAALKARSSDSRFEEQSNVTAWTVNDGLAYSATLQAGGTVDLSKVANKVQNGTLLENQKEQLTGSLDNDQTGIPAGGIDINLNKHADDTGAAFTAVDPTTSPYFQLPKGDYGMFVKNVDPTSHYLIETNPAFASAAGFFSSDYMLGKLGYSADTAWRRLGDGQYETRLIRDAVLARTGQRFLDSDLQSDADQFRYLMDNALASKDALSLSVGVSLTGEQVGALTHDIVWMENSVVDGQSVLVPVLYLAQAQSRNVRGSSLIQGRDLNLVTGGDLLNVGTLRASNNLTAVSNANIYNGGLVEAGNNLGLLAQDSIRNAMAGEIRGTQVHLAAVEGDITNDSTAIQVRDGAGMRTLTDASTSTISARQDLTMQAGRDLINRGALAAGNDVNLTAGRDLNLVAVSDTSVKHEFSDGGHKSSITTDVKNIAATVTAGNNLNMKAGQDVTVIGSNATAGKDLNIEAGRDFNVTSVSDIHNVEGKEKHGKKRIKTEDEQTTQVASVLTAGANFTSQAGRDTTLIASKISAGNEAYLYTAGQMNLLAAENSTHTLYDMKKNSGWGSKKTQRDEVTRITNVGTEITTGGDLTLKSGGDQTYQLAKLQSANDITLDSGGAITFEAVKDLHQESHEKTNNNAFWVASKGKGNTDETLRQSQLIAEGSVAIKAVDGLKIDINQVNQQTVSESIDAMVKADPQLAWIKDAQQRGDVDWRQVKEIHDSFKYSNSGLGPASQIIIAIVMAAVVGPMAAAAAGGGTVGAVAGAVAAGASTNASVSVVNNRGNLGAVFKDVTSSDAMKGYVVAGATAGLTAAYFDGWTGTTTDRATGAISSPALNTWSGAGQFAASQTLQNGTSMLVGKALGQGGSASDALKSALFNTLAAVSFQAVGDYTKGRLTDGYPPKILVHAMVGGLLAEVTGGDFKTGALAAGVNEAVVGHLNTLVKGDKTLLSMSSQIVGVLAAATQKDADANSLEKGGWVAKNATQYNHALHKSQTEALDEQRKFHPEQADRLNAAACALVRCAESIPTNDPDYDAYKGLQDRGETYGAEIALLEATGQFGGRSWKDWSDDTLNAHGKAVQVVGASKDTALGLVGGVGGYAGMIVSSPACVGVVTCALPVGLGALGTTSMVGAWDSASQITAPFKSAEPGRVADSFYLETFPGESSITSDLAWGSAKSAAQAALFGGAGKYFSGQLAGELAVVNKGVKDVPAPTAGGLDLSKVEVLTIKDARKLDGENKGLIFVQEPQGDFSKPFVKFEAGTTGAFSDVLSERKAVPAIRFDNPNPAGNNFVKFDGVEDVGGITLIDRKTALTTFDKQIQSVQRVSSALKQNPGIKAVFEFPTQKAADRATDILIEQNIRNISVRVAP
ncbi:filamentous hemagglutinin N-terminal domain-containing protein [Pseudomonas kairouanensis]|uniref:Filamentous hemagglutinin N-terminal domain-containing protein n=1 Tax=Pseudomonas kairouanensis TaxID=2293832 RepID=A0A4Z0APF6_9PSED|nr:DUF637 domain-containing protein [Pseudomonas kairouanensis]TFY88300.1 filamentous hemagglutinin N-terminal domain-containing protein [Pseudomonas kairouanensis]